MLWNKYLRNIKVLKLWFTALGNSNPAERDIIPEAYPPILRPLDERDIQRTYFAQEETYVITWNECFKSETKNFMKNKYTLHKIGKKHRYKHKDIRGCHKKGKDYHSSAQ